MSITLSTEALNRTLEKAYVLAIGSDELPESWTVRAIELDNSPSVAAIAAFGAALLAKATDERVDAFAIQAKDGSPGSFNLRAPATVLAQRKNDYGIDIGSSSDRDPINAGTFVSSTNWRYAHDRIRDDHKPFFKLILTWLKELNDLNRDQALLALAAYLRARSLARIRSGAAALPDSIPGVPNLESLVDALDGFSAAHPEGGATGMAIVAAVYRAAGLNSSLPSRNDPRPIDIRISRGEELLVASEVKQVPIGELVAQSLAADAAAANAPVALLAVLRPGELESFDRNTVAREAAHVHGVIFRTTVGARELMHEAILTGTNSVEEFRERLPRLVADALVEARVSTSASEAWAALAGSWVKSS